MDLPAQAIRCSLDGVYPPENSDGSRGSKYPQETYEFIRRFRLKSSAKYIAFFSEWLVGQVGHTSEKPYFEFMARVIL